MSEENVGTCESCGAAVYPEHMDSGIAGFHGGRQLCPHCFSDAKKGEAGQADDDVLDSIAILDDATSPEDSMSTSRFRDAGSETLAEAAAHTFDEEAYKRETDPTSPYATRCRTFHAKLSDGAVAYMNGQLNHWLDENPKISVKFATSSVGVFEGKHQDLHLILTVFY